MAFKIRPFVFPILLCASFYLTAFPGNEIRIGQDLSLIPLKENVWIHVSSMEIAPWGRVQANGLIMLRGKKLLLVDTPWTDPLTRQLSEWFSQNYGAVIDKVIVCHFHDDNLGGLGWINSQGIESYSLEMTAEICRLKGLPLCRHRLAEETFLDFEGSPVISFFPGRGHTIDSIAVYLPDDNILFGGCSVKALSNKTLGNTADADLDEWPQSLQILKARFPDAQIVVPGHGDPGGLELIDHTLTLF